MNIQPTDYRRYPTTFLQNTVVSLYHPAFGQSDAEEPAVVSDMNNFFSENFNLNFGLTGTNQTINLSSNEIDLSYMFTPDQSMLKVGRKDYTVFKASVMPYFYKLKDYVYSVLRMQSVECMRIRKVNMFPVRIDVEQPTDEMWESVRRYLFNKELFELPLQIGESLPVPENAVGKFERRQICNVETCFIIRTGITRMSSDSHGYNMVLDISSSTPQGAAGLTEDQSERTILQLNKHLFDLFNSVISDNLKHILKTTPSTEEMAHV